MPGAYVICDVHGLVEDQSGFSFASGSDVKFYGSTSSCPICRRPAPVANAHYTTTPEGEPIVNFQLTKSQAERLRKSLAWAKQEMAKPDPDAEHAARVLEATIEQTVPEMAPLLEKLKTRLRYEYEHNLVGWVSLLVTIMFGLIALHTSQPTITTDDLEKIVESVESAHHEQGEPAPEAPTKTPPTPPVPQ